MRSLPSMILLFSLITVVLFGIFWGGSLVAQGYFYQNPADRLPIRAAIAALLVGLFITYWVNLDQRFPGKYDTFFSFSGESTRDIEEFEAVRWQFDPVAKGLKKDAQGQYVETISKYKRVPGGKTATFAEEASGKKFATHDAEMMTAAIIVKDDAGNPVKLKAQLKGENYISDQNERRFVEENGSRYIMHARPGVMHVPSSGVIATALLLNFTLFAVWFVAFCFVLRFNPGHALGFTAIFGLAMMLLVLPLLFKPNREGNRVAAIEPALKRLTASASV